MASADPDKCKQLLRQPCLTDFAITCDGITFKVHKVILHLHSAYFAAMFRNEYQETVDGVMNISRQPGEHPYVIAHMLQFMYLGEYDYEEPLISHTVTTPTPSLSMGPCYSEEEKVEHGMHLYLAADKYGVRGLQEYAKTKLYKVFLNAKNMFAAPLPRAEILDPFFTHTTSDDLLRLDIMDYLLKNLVDISPEIKETVLKHEPMAWYVGVRLQSQAEVKSQAIMNFARRLSTEDHAALTKAMSVEDYLLYL